MNKKKRRRNSCNDRLNAAHGPIGNPVSVSSPPPPPPCVLNPFGSTGTGSVVNSIPVQICYS